ncbi:MAG: hypothetical protein ABIO70_25815 [Pseudomonadota bacterium]
MAGKYVTFEELVGKVNAGEEPACQAPFGGIGRPWGRPRTRTPLPLLDPATPVEDVFDCFEAHGLRPYPQVPLGNPQGRTPSRRFFPPEWSRELAIARLEACSSAPQDTLEAVEPDPRFGVNNPSLYFHNRTTVGPDLDARTTEQYGFPPAVAHDLARAGVGTLRHIQEADLVWAKLFDPLIQGQQVPIAAPWDMKGLLEADQWAALSRFTYMVITCLYTGQQLIPLLFGEGGGSGTARTDVDAFKPSFQKTAYIPEDAGWDAWYWAFVPWRIGDSLYQRYALNLIPAPSGADRGYARSCCHRKMLGLLSFSAAIADYLEILDAAIYDCTGESMRLADVVPAFECGNEMGSYYQLSFSSTRKDAAQEMGRYHALLAGPIVARDLGLRPRLGETYFYLVEHSDWTDNILPWLRETITDGIADEVARWHRVVGSPSSDPEWTALAREAGWQWWTSAGASSVRDLVRETGFHWFTWTDEIYRAETGFSEEAMEFMAEVADHQRVTDLVGDSLTWSCCVGFQGSQPSAPGSVVGYDEQYYSGNTLLYEGGLLVRRLLAAFAQPARPRFVTWYTAMGPLTDAACRWDLFSATGLRNVLFQENPSKLTEDQGAPVALDELDFLQGTHAWRRPAWFALRRLVWLRARAWRLETIFSSPTGAWVLRLSARGGFRSPQAPFHDATDPGYAYAYICWLDPVDAASSAAHSFTLRLFGEGDWEVLPLVPIVTCSASGLPDENGFPALESLDWSVTPQLNTASRTFPGAFGVQVFPADPTSNPAPICVLCDHEQLGVTVDAHTAVEPRERAPRMQPSETKPRFHPSQD